MSAYLGNIQKVISKHIHIIIYYEKSLFKRLERGYAPIIQLVLTGGVPLQSCTEPHM